MATGWYIAELVMEIKVADDQRNVVHQNLVLIRAESANEAYNKAIKLGEAEETSYDNPSGKLVTIKFRGISDLDEIYDELQDGAELSFRCKIDVSESEMRSLILTRDRLRAFLPPKRTEGPDYASGEIVSEIEHRFGIKRPSD
jgi:Domain of unknown function (DUF4288)